MSTESQDSSADQAAATPPQQNQQQSQQQSPQQSQQNQQHVVDITQRATNPNPTTGHKLKDPKRVAAGKKSAEKRQLARIAHEKALQNAQKGNEKLKSQVADRTATTTTQGRHIEPHPPNPATEHTEQSQQTQHTEHTQQRGDNKNSGAAFWLSIAGIATALITTFVRREDLQALKNYFTKNNTPRRQNTLRGID